MHYVLIKPKQFGTKLFDIPFEDIVLVHHGTFGCFNNYNDVLIVKYIKYDPYDGEEKEELKIFGHFKSGKNIYGNLGFDFFLGKDPKSIWLYNFNSEYTKEDVEKILKTFCK